MGMYKEAKKNVISGFKTRSETYRSRLIKWHAEDPITKIAKPTNIARARELGYRAKQGVIVARVRVVGGKKHRKRADGGRKPSKSASYYTRHKSLKQIAEEKAARKFLNCEVLNSYFIGNAGAENYYEVILLDRANSAISSDRIYGSIISQRGRAFRAATHAGKKARGIYK
ncbi:MAG: hypothetical protein QXN59_01795 [Candidatus Micrarchaeaceae archaeon]